MIEYTTGNLFDSPAVIRCHQVNCKGVMGSGIAVEAKQRYPGMFEEYKQRCLLWGSDNLGDVQFYVAPDKTVLANLFGQDGYGSGHDTDEEALKEAILTVKEFAQKHHCSVGFPEKIGCGLGGGDWERVKAFLEESFGSVMDPSCYIVAFDGENKDAPTSKVKIYTDGSCSGNPGPGGWAAILLAGKACKKLSGGEPLTTNNQMELEAAIQGLSALKMPCEVDLYSDSSYLVNAISKGWLAKWKRTGWMRSRNEEVKNREYWERLDTLLQKHSVSFHWVKGHSSDPYNQMCDELAVSETQKFK